MVHRRLVVLVDPFAKDDERVTDEQMGDVFGQGVVDTWIVSGKSKPLNPSDAENSLACDRLTVIKQPLVNRLVHRTVDIVIMILISRVGRDVSIHRVVPRFRDPELVVLERLPKV
jgi:hypothetical protein